MFAGKPPSSELGIRDIVLKFSDGTRTDFPQGARNLGLTDSLREIILRCMHQNPTQRPDIMEVIELLRELMMSSLSMEADLRDFFEVCKTRGRDGQGEKARQFADELDEVRRTESHSINTSYHRSRCLTARAFSRKNGSNI